MITKGQERPREESQVEYGVYKTAAHLYDMNAWLDKISKDDVPFYSRHAMQQNGEILVLACGTGRVAIPLAEQGYKVVGLDVGESMLDHFREKAGKLAAEVRSRLMIVQGDMSQFKLNRRFGLIVIPFRSFQCLTAPIAPRACLRAVREHLDKGGVFILSVFKADKDLMKKWMIPERKEWEKIDKEAGVKVIKTSKTTGIDSTKQTVSLEATYKVFQLDGTVREVKDVLSLKYYSEAQLKKMLREEGFVVCMSYGYYDERPASKGDELILVCRRKEDARELYGFFNVKWFVSGVLRKVVRALGGHTAGARSGAMRQG